MRLGGGRGRAGNLEEEVSEEEESAEQGGAGAADVEGWATPAAAPKP